MCMENSCSESVYIIHTRKILYQPISGGKTAFRLSFVCTPRTQFYFFVRKFCLATNTEYSFAVITDNSAFAACVQIHCFRPRCKCENVSKYVKISLLCMTFTMEIARIFHCPMSLHISHRK